jgi:murein DD-endopeptidase MepM/ murein hydrolase activator NlpD
VALGVVVVSQIIVPPFLRPVDGQVTSRFFLRNAPDSTRLFDFEQHRGIDFAAPTGTPVQASRSGTVVRVDVDPSYGLLVDVRHTFGLVSRYAHLSFTDVAMDERVRRGSEIGRVGSSGRATGPHLHFEIRAGRPLPPGPFLVFHRIRRGLLR